MACENVVVLGWLKRSISVTWGVRAGESERPSHLLRIRFVAMTGVAQCLRIQFGARMWIEVAQVAHRQNT